MLATYTPDDDSLITLFVNKNGCDYGSCSNNGVMDCDSQWFFENTPEHHGNCGCVETEIKSPTTFPIPSQCLDSINPKIIPITGDGTFINHIITDEYPQYSNGYTQVIKSACFNITKGYI